MPKLELLKGKYSNCSSELELRKTLSAEGYDLFEWQDRPGNFYSPHQHGHDEFIVVQSGSIVFTIGGTNYRLEAGDMLVLPHGTVHSAVNDGKQTVHYFICSLKN